MTLVQLEYIVAVETYGNFSIAAQKCFVTQPTLSMQLRKIEDELEVKIFDRSKKPVIATAIGKEIIKIAKEIIAGTKTISELISEQKGKVRGELKLAIIPTIAPYLVPLFLQKYLQTYPEISIKIVELTTERIIDNLKKNLIDVGILVTPIKGNSIKTIPLYYEEFVLYMSKSDPLLLKDKISLDDIDTKKLWLLEEGHCFRTQMTNLCDRKKNTYEGKVFQYEAGSIETLKKMVERNNGITILPELATLDFRANQLKQVRRFKSPAPVREVSLVTHRDHIKKRLIDVLKKEIIDSLPRKILEEKKKDVIAI